MKETEVTVKLRFLEKGDRVCTPSGDGTVIEDQVFYTDRMRMSDLHVLLDEPNSSGFRKHIFCPDAVIYEDGK
jgi:hypothetical protein